MSDSSKTKSDLIEENKKLRDELNQLKNEDAQSKSNNKRSASDLFLSKHILETIPDPIVILQDGCHRFTSPSFTKMLGYTHDDLTEAGSFLKIIHPDYHEIVLERIKARKRGDKLHRLIIVKLIAKNGNVIKCEVTASTIEYEGKLADLVMLRNISNERMSSTKLEALARNYSDFLESMNEGFGVIDENGVITYYNKYLSSVLEYNDKELIGRSLASIFQDIDQDIVVRIIETHKKGKCLSSEISLITKKGKTVNFIASSRPVFDDNNNFRGSYAILTDITNLIQTKETYRSVVDNSLQGLVVLHDNELIFANKVFTEITGFTVEDIRRMKGGWRETIHPDYREEFAKRYQERLEEKTKSESYEFRGIKKNNDIYWCQAFVSTIDYFGMKATQIAFLDITSSKQANLRLKESEEQFRQLSEQSPNMIFINQGGRVVYANAKCVKAMGYSTEEFYSDSFEFMCLIHDKDKPNIIENIKRHSQGQDVPPHEYTLLTKDGEKIEVIITTKNITFKGDNAILGIVTDITDRKMVEDALRESEEKFRRAFTDAGVGFCLVSPDGILIQANPFLCQKLGYTEKELIGKHFNDFTHPEDLKIGINVLKNTNGNNQELFQMDKRYINKDGNIIHASVATSLLKDNNGNPLYFVTQVIDITKRKKAEQDLIESENKFRSITENASDYIFIKDVERKYTFVNKAMSEMIGLPKNEIIGKKPNQIFGIEQGKIIKKVDDPTFAGEIVNEIRELEIGEDKRFFNTIQSPLTWDGNQVTTIMGVVRDITEYKQAEDWVNLLSQVTKQVSDSIITTDLDEKITYVNDAFHKLFGYSKEEIIGQSPRILNVSKNAEKIQEEIYKNVSNGKEWKGVISNRRKDGSVFPCELTVYSLTDENGEIYSFAATQRDISEQIMAEEQLKKATKDLEKERSLLEEKNIALREIMSQIESEKNLIKSQMATNIEKILVPSLKRIKENAPDNQRKLIDHLEIELKSLILSNRKLASEVFSELTPREIEICGMVKNGFQSKEIAQILNISILTVNKHREIIRKKLGLANKNINLNTYLQSK